MVDRCNAGGNAQVQILEWSETQSQLDADLQGHQMILGADLVYNRRGVAQLLPTLKSLIKRSPECKLALGHCSRQSHVDELLFAGLAQIGLTMRKVAVSEQDNRVAVHMHMPQRGALSESGAGLNW